ncbi:hypothetical protein ACFVAD_08280 [Sutcliffiella sp. NPDC057660]|uniref:hypothetical protein n=1 Tax=Sutcliffiella sp. NPDC057660 TaxID=3346199 RepID=UPI0036826FD6
MSISWMKMMISIVAGIGIVTVLTGGYQWGIFAGVIVGVGSVKWLRLKKQEENEEIVYDERVNNVIKKLSFQTLAISNCLLLLYFLLSNEILQTPLINTNFLILYLSLTLFISFYLIPFIARKN